MDGLPEGFAFRNGGIEASDPGAVAQGEQGLVLVQVAPVVSCPVRPDVEAFLDFRPRLLQCRAHFESPADGRPVDAVVVSGVFRRGQAGLVGGIRLNEIQVAHGSGVVARVAVVAEGEPVEMPVDEAHGGVAGQENGERQETGEGPCGARPAGCPCFPGPDRRES